MNNGRTMNIAMLLAPDDVVFGLRAADKKQLVHELAKRAGAKLGIAVPVIAEALLEREELGSTGLGKGFALPHARVPGLDRCFGMFARLNRPIDFLAIDEQHVDLVFLLLIPPDAQSEHNAALAAISRRMREPAILDRARQAKDANVLHRLIAGETRGPC